jgi:hypothetical protein
MNGHQFKGGEMRRAGIAITMALTTGVAVWAAGTALTVAFGTPTVTCPDGNVSADYTITSNAASGAVVTEKLTDASNAIVVQQSYDILPGNVPGGWTFGVHTKMYESTFTHNGLSNGTYSLQVCVTQPGSGGNPDKTVCNSVTIVVACAETWNPCANVAPFGEVVGNNKITDHSTAQINFEGDFGPVAHVEISKTIPNWFYRSANVSRNGDSCNYHANWKFTTDDGSDMFGNDGPGVYTVKVSGNNHNLEFSVTLVN